MLAWVVYCSLGRFIRIIMYYFACMLHGVVNCEHVYEHI